MQAYEDQAVPSNTTERFWWIFRGTKGEQGVRLGAAGVLPLGARLKLYTNENVAQPARSQIQVSQQIHIFLYKLQVSVCHLSLLILFVAAVHDSERWCCAHECPQRKCGCRTISGGRGEQE